MPDPVEIHFRGPDGGSVFVASGESREKVLAAIAAQGGKVVDDSPLDSPLSREQAAVEGLSFMRGAEDLAEGLYNTARRPFADPLDYLDTLVEQAVDSKKDRDEIGRRTANLEAVGGRAYPGLARALPRMAAETAVAAVTTKNLVRPLSRVLANAGIAGLFEGAASSDQPAASVAAATAKGAGIGLLASAAFELPAAVQRYIGPDLVQALKARGKLGEVDPFHMTDDARQAGIRLTPAEALGGHRLRRLYRQTGGATGAEREQFEIAQRQDVESLFGGIADRLLPAGINNATPTVRIRTALTAARETLTNTVHRLHNTASSEFNRILAPAIARANARVDPAGRIVGGSRVLPSRNLEQELASQITAAQERRAPQREVAAMLERLRLIQGPRGQGGWTLGGYQAELAEVGRRLYANRQAGARSVLDQGASFDERRIREAMMADLDDGIMGLQGNAATRDVAMALRDARDAYRQNIDEVNWLEGQAVDRLLGGDQPFTGDEFTKRFFSLEDDAQLEIMRFLDRERPEAADGLRGVMFQSAVERARGRSLNPDPDNAQLFDLHAFVDEFGRMNASQQGMMLPRLLPAERVRVGAGLRVLKTLTEAPGRLAEAVGGAKPVMQRMEQAAINLVLHNSGFVARFFAGEIAPHALERMFYTPEGLRAFMELGKPNLTRSMKQAAVAALLTQAAHAEQDVQDIRFAAEQEAAQAELEARAASGGLDPGLR